MTTTPIVEAAQAVTRDRSTEALAELLRLSLGAACDTSLGMSVALHQLDLSEAPVLRDDLVRVYDLARDLADALLGVLDVVAPVPEQDDEYEPWGCECEQDYNCHLHRNRVGTWIETRYDHLPNDPRDEGGW